MRSFSVNRVATGLFFVVVACGFSHSNTAFGQILPPTMKADHVKILQGPSLEIAVDDLAILRWTVNNPGGLDDHYAVVHYGTDPKKLNQMAKSHIRLNREHSETVFRVRMTGLKPKTTYYYTVTSIESNGVTDGEHSSVRQFTTPAPGQRIAPET